MTFNALIAFGPTAALFSSAASHHARGPRGIAGLPTGSAVAHSHPVNFLVTTVQRMLAHSRPVNFS